MKTPRSQFEAPIPVGRQIQKQVREQIMSGRLASGERLPSTQELAVHWKTHVTTVHRALTPLVRQGLLTRIRRVGTFVRTMDPKMTCVGIYYTGDFWLQKTFAFYGALHAELQKLLQRSGINLMVWVDPRKAGERKKPWQALVHAAKHREIQALIVPIFDAGLEGWLDKVPVPNACFRNINAANTVWLDLLQFAELSLQRAVEQGCRSVGMIAANPSSDVEGAYNFTNARFYEHFENRARDLGLALHKEWIRHPPQELSGDRHARFGYDQFRALWQQRERPEAVVVWPDSVAHGVLMAISEHGVRVPRDLKLIFHKNDKVDLFCTVPASFALTRVQDVAAALWEQIRRQSQGERGRPILVPFQIQQANVPRGKSRSGGVATKMEVQHETASCEVV